MATMTAQTLTQASEVEAPRATVCMTAFRAYVTALLVALVRYEASLDLHAWMFANNIA